MTDALDWQVDLGDGYRLSTDRERLDLAAIANFLSNDSYWAQGRAFETILKSIVNSLPFGLYDGTGAQADFTRPLDGATGARLQSSADGIARPA